MSKRTLPLTLRWQVYLLGVLIACLAIATTAGILFLIVQSPSVAAESNAAAPQWTSAQVIQAFVRAGLPFEIPSLPRDERDTFSGLIAADTKLIHIPNQGADANGMILCFKNARDLRRMEAYYAALGNALPQYSSWIYVHDNVILQINGSVPEAVASHYAAALNQDGDW